MLSIKTILHPTDFSAHAGSALSLACSLARDYRAKLIMLHVQPNVPVAFGEFGSLPSEPAGSAESLRKRVQDLLPASFKGASEIHLVQGDAAAEIVAMAKHAQANLIVMGTHGRTGLGRLILGSVTEQVMREASCPVLTVRLPQTPGSVAVEPPEEPRAQSTDELSTVYSVINPIEAEIIRNALKSEGIRCVLEGAQQAAAVGVQAFPIKIQVRANDADRASRLIRERGPR